MITCQKCKSTNVRINNGNFATVKREGEASAKHSYDTYYLFCEKCETRWESTPESQKDYWEYVELCARTRVVVRNAPSDNSPVIGQHVDLSELSRRKELAKKISTLYTHLLDLDPGEWHEIESDVSQ